MARQDGWKQAQIAAAMGVSRKCVKYWLDRYEAEGEAGLETRSSRPHLVPTKTVSEVEENVVAARAEHRDGPGVLASKVGVPARTSSRILRRHGVPYLPEEKGTTCAGFLERAIDYSAAHGIPRRRPCPMAGHV